MILEILEDTEGNLSTWRDPYEWVDPFAEAEEWALRYGRVRQRERHEHDAIHRSYRDEISHLNHVIHQQRSVIETLGPLQTEFRK